MNFNNFIPSFSIWAATATAMAMATDTAIGHHRIRRSVCCMLWMDWAILMAEQFLLMAIVLAVDYGFVLPARCIIIGININMCKNIYVYIQHLKQRSFVRFCRIVRATVFSMMMVLANCKHCFFSFFCCVFFFECGYMFSALIRNRSIEWMVLI